MRKTVGILLASAIALVALAIPALGSSAAQTLRVTEVDGRISLSARPRGGMVKFVVRNGGDEGTTSGSAAAAGVRRRVSRRRQLGDADRPAEERVRYSYWCGVSDHAQEGMRGGFVAR